MTLWANKFIWEMGFPKKADQLEKNYWSAIYQKFEVDIMTDMHMIIKSDWDN